MDSKQYKFKGVIIKCTYNTPDYKIYAVVVNKNDYPDIKQNKYNNVSILGELADLTLGVEYEITAEEQVNKYGTSYKVINIKRDVPTTVEGTHLFLSEILTENQARVLVENYPNIIQKVTTTAATVATIISPVASLNQSDASPVGSILFTGLLLQYANIL